MHTQVLFQIPQKESRVAAGKQPGTRELHRSKLKKMSYTSRSPESSQANDPALGGYIISKLGGINTSSKLSQVNNSALGGYTYTSVNKLERREAARQKNPEKNSDSHQNKPVGEVGKHNIYTNNPGTSTSTTQQRL